MKCEEVDKLMLDYLDKNLDENLTGEIEKHLAACERCIDELKDTQQVLRLISEDEMVLPDDSLKINFYHMLHSETKRSREIKRNKEGSIFIPQNKIRTLSFLMKNNVAAGIALLICGTFIGILLHASLINNSREIRHLQAEVSALKEASALTMLRQESSSDRIQAVNLIEEFDRPDEKVIEVLIRTLNHDKNVNVRMAAAFALSKYSQSSVSDSLVNSLSLQDNPILQITLINILVERREKKALQPIRKIIEDNNTRQEVKTIAENGLKVLI